MPDPRRVHQQTGDWFGIYRQDTVPSDLSKQFTRVSHNVVLKGGMPHTRPGLRRVNTSLFGNAGDRDFYGLAVWRVAGGQDLLIGACGDQLQSLETVGGTPVALTESFPTGFPARVGARTVMVRHAGNLYIVNGTDENVKFNGTDLTRMGLETPTTVPAPVLAAGALTGTFDYRATLVSDTAHGSLESEPTAIRQQAYTAQQGTFSAPAVPNTDPQVDRWNLYRTIAGPGATFFKVNLTPVTLATSIIDNTTDAVLTAGPTLDPLGTNTAPGILTTIAEHQGRIVGVPAANPNSIIWSDLGASLGVFFKPESFPSENTLDFRSQGGSKVTALISFHEFLLVFQDFGTWSITGDLNDPTNRTISPRLVAPNETGIGVSEVGNIGPSENALIIAAKDGFYRVRRDVGRQVPELAVERLSQNIDALYEQIDFGSGGTAIYNRDDESYVLWGKGSVA